MSKFKIGDRVYDIPTADGYTRGYGTIIYILRNGYQVRFDNFTKGDYHRLEKEIKSINSELVKEKLGLQKAKK